MDAERKINLCEGVPLNSSSGAANIFFNTNKNRKDNDGTVIHLKTEKPADVGVHINTTFSIASSKKIKLLFVLNFLLSVICMIISCSLAFYYWNEMILMKKQIELVKEQFLIQNFKNGVLEQARPEQSALVSNFRPPQIRGETREARMNVPKEDISPNARRYYVEDLGEDMLLVDSSKKDAKEDKTPTYDISALQKEPVIAHFNGAMREVNIGSDTIIGPWQRDVEASSKDSENKIELHKNYVTIKESGLYLVYAQVVYLTHAPNCYFIWARQPMQEPRLISACATGDDSSNRPLDKSQISCSTQTIARLHKGDTVNLAQRERNRTLWLRPGYTYFGLVKISN